MTSLQPAISQDIAWRSARACNNGQCVEVASLPDGRIAMRDNKIAENSPVLRFAPEDWRAFIHSIKSGEITESLH
ncbi:DUF397 domain-containing protein [Streptosporangium subroseum]|uniref:DUF397 domain-containing protein n=1 Tax=Streptosporangium subroseum TaxID=106412 RepID=UPI000B78F5A9|nr:DUF397 domain-containing protein [Streptosporangium subroseum]